MAEAKKRLLTYAGLKAIEDELENLKVVREKKLQVRSKRQESRGTFPRTLSMMQRKTSREISKPVSRSLRQS